MSELRLGQDKKYLEKKAKDEKLILVLPEPDEVFLDIDEPGGKPDQRIMEYITQSVNEINITSSLTTISKSGNSHVYLRLGKPVSDLTRVILQVCLGSDPVKELFSFIQLNHVIEWTLVNCECPIAFFETKDGYDRVLLWRADMGPNGIRQLEPDKRPF